MTAQASPQPTDFCYVNVSEVVEYSEGRVDVQPYRSRWSLQPFLDDGPGIQPEEREWLESVEEQLRTLDDDPTSRGRPLPTAETQRLVRYFFPPFKHSMRLGALVRPLSPQEVLVTPDWYDLLTGGQIVVGRKTRQHTAAVRAGLLILNQCYGQHLRGSHNTEVDYRHTDSSLQSHLKVLAGYDYVRVLVDGEKPPLSRAQIRELLGNLGDTELWLRYLPPSKFRFVGIEVNHVIDATEDIARRELQELLLKREAVLSESRIREMEAVLANYLRVPDLRLGIMALDFPRARAVPHRYLIRQDILSGEVDDILNPDYGDKTIYYQTCEGGVVRIFDDLSDCLDDTGPLEQAIVDKGYNSLVLVPLFGKNDYVIGMLELASERAFSFNNLVIYLLEAITPLFRQAIRRSRDDMEARIQAVMRTNFTALDPSIEWRFVRAAADIIGREQNSEGDSGVLPEIRFEEVHALYAQADIVGSSQMRNAAIQADLLAELAAARALLESPAVALRFPLSGKLVFDIGVLQAELENGMSPNEEQHVLEFLRDQLNPTLEQLEQSDGLEQRIGEYRVAKQKSLSNGLSHREAYERSVRRVTSVVNNVISAAQVEAQRIVPHYFSKYRTDGVEYNIYAGQSLLQEGTFSEIHLQNLRLWQLQTMVDVTKAIAGIRSTLDVPMSTAQLIFAFGSTITIQFRMDEKRFDVEGAYNVRYEVIKKRIDKALIRGTEERLTQADHVAVVYSHHADRQVYRDLIDYLYKTGEVAEEVEELELEPMQGVDGLHALRVRVIAATADEDSASASRSSEQRKTET